ncbi:MAG: glycine--tRNA ligase [Kiritimatiellae bacterium]|jgi:glycyl-tRNA synthetase|nr:glycine--tRNA ligase [Kiritimatiellia bacterium]
MSNESSLSVITTLCKRRGFIFHSSEIYGGMPGFFDYGPLGCEMKRNIKEDWWKTTVRNREDVEGLDATIIMHPDIWKASGHLDTFSDPMTMCKACKKLMRADQIWDIFADSDAGQSLQKVLDESNGEAGKIVAWCKGKAKGQTPNLPAVLNADVLTAAYEKLNADAASYADLKSLYTLFFNAKNSEQKISPCPHCGGELTEPRPFNLMFKTVVGPIDDEKNTAYLRPETAQAIFAQFLNVLATSRQSVPFGIAQIGKSFRNEVTPRNYTFRSREFEQMELEFFIRPDEAVELIYGKVTTLADNPDLTTPEDAWGWEVWHRYWVTQRKGWVASCGLPVDSFVESVHEGDDLAHYARACVDLEYRFPFGVQELEGIAARSDFDLSQHQKHSGKSMEVFDEPLKLACKKMDDAAKSAFMDKVVADWTACGKDEAVARAFVARLFEGRYIPHVIEPSAGVDRMMLALLCNAYDEQKLVDSKGKEDTRLVMHFQPRIAPIKVAVFPLVKNKPEIYNKAREVFEHLRRRYAAFWDQSGAIGRRYRRQDEIGTPWCVTVDFDTMEDGTMTVRDRDSMEQKRMTLDELKVMMDEALLV